MPSGCHACSHIEATGFVLLPFLVEGVGICFASSGGARTTASGGEVRGAALTGARSWSLVPRAGGVDAAGPSKRRSVHQRAAKYWAPLLRTRQEARLPTNEDVKANMNKPGKISPELITRKWQSIQATDVNHSVLGGAKKLKTLGANH